MSEKHAFSVGQTLAGRYRIEAELGRGGMGSVLTARHVLLDQLYAIKVIHPHLANEPEIVERFLREARASSIIKSPHCAHVHDVDRLPDGPPYMVMEHLEGSDLAKVLAQRGTFAVSDALDCVRQACDAIGEAHARGIYHRDLKPGNLFLTRDRHGAPQVKVLDFGISKLADSTAEGLTRTDTTLGTPAYMSPEQVVQAKNVDGRTDIWALGCILYRLLTGVLPFRQTATRSTQQAVLQDAPEPPTRLRPDLPVAVEAIILRCLEKDPEKRYPTASQLVEAIDAIGPTGQGAQASASTAAGFAPPAGFTPPAGFAEPPAVVRVPALSGLAVPTPLPPAPSEPQEAQPKSLPGASSGASSVSSVQARSATDAAPLVVSGAPSESTTTAGLSRGHAVAETTSPTEARLRAERRKRVRTTALISLGAALLIGMVAVLKGTEPRLQALQPMGPSPTSIVTIAPPPVPSPAPSPPLPPPTASAAPTSTPSGSGAQRPPPPATATARPAVTAPAGGGKGSKCNPEQDAYCRP